MFLNELKSHTFVSYMRKRMCVADTPNDQPTNQPTNQPTDELT